MRILVDEDLASRALLSSLEDSTGLEPLPPRLEDSDADVWARAQEEQAAVLTGNARDFVRLARAHADHAGLLLVVRKNEPGDLAARHIVAALEAVADAYPGGIAGLTLVVNGFAPERR